MKISGEAIPAVAAGDAAAVDTQTVVVFGETLVDQFRDRNVLGGAPFNVACHLQALGAHPVLVTRTGKDPLGEQLLQAMSLRGLDLRGVQTDPVRPTGRVRVTETGSGHAFDILSEQAYDHIHASLARLVTLSVHPHLVYFGTLSQRGASRRALRELLGVAQAPVFLDANLRDPWVDDEVLRRSLQQADVVKLNEGELIRVAETFSLAGRTLEARAGRMLEAFGLQRLVITCGAEGAWTLDAAGRFQSVAGKPLAEVVDTVGAGDGFAAVFMLGMLRRWPLTTILARADAFARAVCRIRGAVPDSPDFYLPFVRGWQLEPEVARA